MTLLSASAFEHISTVLLFITNRASHVFSLQDWKQQRLRYKVESSTKNHRKNIRNRPPDGHFNGFPVFYHDLAMNKSYHSKPYSSIRCVGENYQGEDFSWMHRSCHFRFLCFNVSSREFEIYARPDDEGMRSVASHRYPFLDVSASLLLSPADQNHTKIGHGLSLASDTVRHPKERNDNADGDRNSRRRRIKAAYKWFPTVVQSSPPEQYYALDEDVIFLPFDSLLEGERRRGKEYSVVWDDLLPIYTLLNMFQLENVDNNKEALLIRYIGGTEIRVDDNRKHLERKMDPFRSLLTRFESNDNESFHDTNTNRLETTRWTTQTDATLTSTTNSVIRSQLVCAKDGLAGLGPHGIRKPEGKRSANLLSKNGRGSLLWKFRNYCIGNLGLLPSPSSWPENDNHAAMNATEKSDSTVRVIFSTQAYSIASLGDGDSGESNIVQTRNSIHESTPLEVGLRDFLVSGGRIQSRLNNNTRPALPDNNYHRVVVSTNSSRIHIELQDFSNYSTNLTNRVELMMGTTVFVATCSEATATAAIFLPRSASLVVLFETNKDGKNLNGDPTTPNCADYRDLLNNLSHVHVNWLPTNAVSSNEDGSILFDLVQRGVKISEKEMTGQNRMKKPI
eukprot:jgi/Psemu1/323652/estExt_fgenesh1_pg.C_850023